MRIGFADPYFDSLGGGERYLLTLAAHWSGRHRVSIFWDDPSVLEKASARFNLDLSGVTADADIFKRRNLLKKLFHTAAYDCIVFLTDGSVPSSLARYNILHIQVPFGKISMPPYKKRRFQAVVCNSAFTRNHVDPVVGNGAHVIYPPVDIRQLRSGRKEKTILSVGRFNALYRAKKQDVMIRAFSEGLREGKFRGWKLVLAGGMLPSDGEYFRSLEHSADGLPVEFLPNCTFERLSDLYATSAIYWHAAGFGETDPQHMEHFGISTVEAMASGSVPVVYAGGGQPDIIGESGAGFLWNSTEELVVLTDRLIHDAHLRKGMAESAITRASDFDVPVFNGAFDRLLEQIDGAAGGGAL